MAPTSDNSDEMDFGDPDDGTKSVSSFECNLESTRARDGRSGDLTTYVPMDVTESDSQIQNETPAIAPEAASDAHDNQSVLVPEVPTDDAGSQPLLIMADHMCSENVASVNRNERVLENNSMSTDGVVEEETHDQSKNLNTSTTEDDSTSTDGGIEEETNDQSKNLNTSTTEDDSTSTDGGVEEETNDQSKNLNTSTTEDNSMSTGGGVEEETNDQSKNLNTSTTEDNSMSTDGGVEEETNDQSKNLNTSTTEDFGLPSTQTPQRRPRSSSPSELLENANKKSAVICNFFAKGWCIKGNSCMFLHQKEGSFHTSPQVEENLAGTSRRGSRENAERPELSASEELLGPSRIEGSSKSPFVLQRALVRAYGEENHELSKANFNHIPGAMNIRRELHEVGAMQSDRHMLVEGTYKKGFGLSPRFDILDERRLAGYLNERKVYDEMPKRESSIDSQFSKGSVSLGNTSYYSSGQSIASNLYQNNNNQLAYGKRTDDIFSRNQPTHVRTHDSYSSYGLSISQNSNFNNSLLPVKISPSNRSSIISSEHIDIHKVSEFDRGNYGSRSASLPRNTPLYSEIAGQHNFPRDLVSSAGPKVKVDDAWQPSVPFKSSFLGEHRNISLPGSEYDPLLDSMDPPKLGNITFLNPQRSEINNVTSHLMNGDPTLSSHARGYIAQNQLDSFPQPSEGVLPKNTTAHGSSVYQNAAVAARESNILDGWTSSIPKEEKHLILDSFPQPSEGVLPKNTTAHGSSAYQNVAAAARESNILDGWTSSIPKEGKHLILDSFPQPSEGVLPKNTTAHGSSVYQNAAVAARESNILEGWNSSIPKEDKHLIAGDLVIGQNMNEGDPKGNMRDPESEVKNNKEPKAVKFFRSVLVDFVKELMKPSWREGHISKDAHKMIVKKAVEKVLSALHPHQVPNTAEAANQYLSNSRPKLLKLVEGYVEKYSKT